jgi:hypothetical protein
MTPAIIHDLLDELLARDREYRPIELLLLLRRLDRKGLTRFRADPKAVLEDELYGDPDTIIEQLNWAAARARTLGLEPDTRPRSDREGALFRRATADHQARTRWRRVEEEAQGDLFLDNRLSMARRRLIRSLEEGDRKAAESALSDLSHADPGNDLQADAEHLVEALAWLEEVDLDVGRSLDVLDHDLSGRARRLLGPESADRWLARFFRHLASIQAKAGTSASSLQLHPAALFARAGDWEAVLSTLDELAGGDRSALLLVAEIRAGLALGQRDRAVAALIRLCWLDGPAAEDWLERGEDDELSRRVELFWDLESPLEIALFPAWLLVRGYPVPAIEGESRHEAARALECIRALRADPGDLEARQWLQEHSPELMSHWMGQRPV